MASWNEFAQSRPDMAAALTERLTPTPIAFIATVRRDGAPRLHPFCPIFAEGRMLIAVNPTSPKRWDLRREGGRYAMHALPGEHDEEFYCTGQTMFIPEGRLRAATVAAAGHTVHPADWVFELSIEAAMTAYWENWAQPSTYAVRSFWPTTP